MRIPFVSLVLATTADKRLLPYGVPFRIYKSTSKPLWYHRLVGGYVIETQAP